MGLGNIILKISKYLFGVLPFGYCWISKLALIIYATEREMEGDIFYDCIIEYYRSIHDLILTSSGYIWLQLPHHN